MISLHLNFKQKLSLYTKGIWPVFLSTFIIIGPFLFLIGGGTDAFLDLQFDLKEVIKTQGYITDISRTNIEVDEEWVYRYDYSYPVELETLYGFSYSSEFELEIEDRVPVEYVKGKPQLSRIVGSKMTQHAFLAYIGAGLFLISLMTIPLRLRWLSGIQRLLADASITRGEFRSRQKTNVEINEQTQYKLIYKYWVGKDSFEVSTKTTDPDGMERAINVLYSNRDHSHAILVTDLPHSVYKVLPPANSPD